jgi:hypothetical protein
MKIQSTFVTTILLAAASMTASAATVTFDLGGTACGPAGLCTSKAGVHQIDFESANLSPFSSGIATFTFSPSNVTPFVTGSVNNEYAAPPNDTTKYLSVGSPSRTGEVTIDFSTPINYYGLYLGSPDAYNLFKFYQTGNSNNPIATFTGLQLIPPGNGDQSIGAYVNFYANGGSISRIVLSSTQAALESDNHAYGAVPEPATMSLLGGSLVGLGLLHRRRKQLKL